MRVLHVASEVAPWSQSGGLADVVGALPAAIAAADPTVETAVLSPLYRGVAGKLARAGVVLDGGFAADLTLGSQRYPIRLRSARAADGPTQWYLESPLFDRDGLYGPPSGGDHLDNHRRFALLGRAAALCGEQLMGGPVDILHAHDWQAGLAPVYARLDGMAATAAVVLTIHNLAYRGIFPKSAMNDLGLPWTLFTHHELEFWDQLCFLKGGLAFADAITTVSPTYAREILTGDRGEGLQDFLRWDVAGVVGILNGIDDVSWDPVGDVELAAAYSVDDLSGKALCRRALVQELGLTVNAATPLIGVVTRFAEQKGIELVAEVVPELHRLGARMVVLGSGDAVYEERFRWLAEHFRDHLRVVVGFDVALARRIYGGSDLFLMPSRFEPCGIGQLYAMRYGAIPVVHGVGGLVDSVIDPGDEALAAGNGTGFRFDVLSVDTLLATLARAIDLYRQPDSWSRLVRSAMRRDSSWREPARKYLQVYRDALAAR